MTMEKFFESNIEKHKHAQAQNTNALVMRVVERHKVVDSIKKLDGLIPEKSYGAVWKSVKRLKDSGRILVYEFYDKDAGAGKKVICLNQEALDAFKIITEIVDNQDQSKIVRKIPEFMTQLYSLFNILMKGNDTDRQKIEKRYDINTRSVQSFILDIITDILKVPIDKMDSLEKDARGVING